MLDIINLVVYIVVPCLIGIQISNVFYSKIQQKYTTANNRYVKKIIEDSRTTAEQFKVVSEYNKHILNINAKCYISSVDLY